MNIARNTRRATTASSSGSWRKPASTSTSQKARRSTRGLWQRRRPWPPRPPRCPLWAPSRAASLRASGGGLGAAVSAASDFAAAAAGAAKPLLPGDTLVFGDDAASYPHIVGDDGAELGAGRRTADSAAADTALGLAGRRRRRRHRRRRHRRRGGRRRVPHLELDERGRAAALLPLRIWASTSRSSTRSRASRPSGAFAPTSRCSVTTIPRGRCSARQRSASIDPPEQLLRDRRRRERVSEWTRDRRSGGRSHGRRRIAVSAGVSAALGATGKNGQLEIVPSTTRAFSFPRHRRSVTRRRGSCGRSGGGRRPRGARAGVPASRPRTASTYGTTSSLGSKGSMRHPGRASRAGARRGASRGALARR